MLQEPQSMTPTIIIPEQGAPGVFAASSYVVLDRCAVTRDKVDINLAVACMMAAYFVYGIEYPRKLKCTLLFLERYVCHLPTAGKLPARVSQMYTLLT